MELSPETGNQPLSADEFIAKKNREFTKKKPKIEVKDIGREGKKFFQLESWTFMKQTNNPEKVIVFERFHKSGQEGTIVHNNYSEGDIVYRIGYFIVGKIGNAKGRWIWGQFAPMIPQEDLGPLLEKARQEGVILPKND